VGASPRVSGVVTSELVGGCSALQHVGSAEAAEEGSPLVAGARLRWTEKTARSIRMWRES
jgi:hypothetical protein